MTKKARTGTLYSEVEGELLMEEADSDTRTEETKKKTKK
jgi:hypothetical protein